METKNTDTTTSHIGQTVTNNLNKMDIKYTDRKSISIKVLPTRSAYRKLNDKAMSEKKEYIGSSVMAAKRLRANSDEIDAYFPTLLGVHKNHMDFTEQVKEYLSNFSVLVQGFKELNLTFIYKSEAAFREFEKKRSIIELAFDKAPKTNTTELRDAIEIYRNALHDMEAAKYAFGVPENMSDYILYRHCLLYKDVSFDERIGDIHSNIRFVFVDDEKEKKAKEKMQARKNLAITNYASLLADTEKFNDIYILLSAMTNKPMDLRIPMSDKQERVLNYATENPEKFNKVIADKNYKIKALIETLIDMGELVRVENTQNIKTREGDFIASNLENAVVWFTTPEYKDKRAFYEAKAKNR